MTVALECFKWTLNKPHNRTGGMVLLSMPSDWGSTFGTISFYYDLIFKGHVPLALNHYWIKGGMVIMLLVIVTVHSRLTSSKPYILWA